MEEKINEELEAYLDRYFPKGDDRRGDALVIVAFANLLLNKKCADKDFLEIKHKFKMEELEFERASAKQFHEQILERGRIQRAEERKMLLERKSLAAGRC